MKTIEDVKVGDYVESPKNGSGTVIKKTARTVTVLFRSGKTVKNTYKNKDDYFYDTDF